MPGGGGVGLDPPRGESAPELGDDPQIAAPGPFGEQGGVRFDQTGDQILDRRMG